MQRSDRRLGIEIMLQLVSKDCKQRSIFWRILMCAYVCLLFTGSTYAQEPSKSELYSDRITAVVNGKVILESDIKFYKQPVVRSFTNLGLNIVPRGKDPTDREILDELIVYQLLLQEAQKKEHNDRKFRSGPNVGRNGKTQQVVVGRICALCCV